MSSAPSESVPPPVAAPGHPPTGGDELAVFHRALGDLCRSELPLPRALRLLASDLDKGSLRDAANAMAADVESGTSLGDAYAAHGEHFPQLYRALVETGMESGDLPAALEQIAQHAARVGSIRDRLRAALWRPALSAAVVVGIGSVLLVTVAPQLEELTGIIPATSGLALRGSTISVRLIATITGVALLALLLVAGAITTFLRRPLEASRLGSRFALRVPVLGRVRLLAAQVGVSSTLALLVRRGVPLHRAADLAAATAMEPCLREQVRGLADQAQEGCGLGEAARRAGLFAPSLVWLLEAAEARGEAAEALEDIAQIYQSRFDRALDRAAALTGPLAELLIGVVVFLMAYTFIVPMLEMTGDLIGLTRALSGR